MKSKFMAGFIATLVALVVVIGLAVFLALVLEVDASKNWFTYTAAFLTIATWMGMYNWLKPKDPNTGQNDNKPDAKITDL